jgi:RIO kinase 1
MKTPESLIPAMDCGIIQEVVRPLMSGKEAQIYVVIAGGEECAAKVYKEASRRTFKHRIEYTEGRKTRNSRDQRAVSKRTRHGRKQDEEAWRNTEVDMIYRLRDAGVRVPEPFNFVDGVLVMELVKDADGHPAPRLGDLRFEPDEAGRIYHQLLRETVRMLSAGVIHGDLSDFNVLMGANGPVLIDFPQSLDAASNQGARKFLLRDVGNLHSFVKRYAPDHPVRSYGEEMWSLYESNRLTADSELVGNYRASELKADTGEVLALIEDADRDEQARREGRGEDPRVDFDELSDERQRPRERRSGETLPEAPKPRRTVVDFSHELKSRPGSAKRSAKRSTKRSTIESTKQSTKGSPRRSHDSRAPRRRKSGDAGAAAVVGSDRPAVAKKRGGRRRTKPLEPAAVEGRETASEQRPAPKRAARARKPHRKASSTGTEGSGRADRPARKRRTRRAAGSGTSGDAKPTRGAAAKGPSGKAGSSRHKGEARSEVDSRGAAGATEAPKRPARRRRRRPRKASTREPS